MCTAHCIQVYMHMHVYTYMYLVVNITCTSKMYVYAQENSWCAICVSDVHITCMSVYASSPMV